MKNILILADVQNGFSRIPQTEKLAQSVRELLEREPFDVVIATQFINANDSIYEKLFGWHKLKTAEEIALSPGIQEHTTEVVEKSLYTCINPNFLQRLYQLNDGRLPERVFVAGVDTDCCVLKIATDLFENNIRPVVLTRYCHSNGGDASHEAGLLCLRRLIGQKQLCDKEIFSAEDLATL